MESFYQEPMAIIYNGDALKVLRALPDESTQMCMTSPPYWGLRNYADGASMVWSTDGNCEHIWGKTIHKGRTGWEATPEGQKQFKSATTEQYQSDSNFCSLCGAWRGQLGLEPTPELYVEHLIMIFREVKRVLRRDGSFYLNIADTYSATRSYQVPQSKWQSSEPQVSGIPMSATMTPKCMVCIPERVMFAMLEDGWILRNKIIWHKPNNMPSSVKSRFTSTWEYLLFFSKNTKTLLWRNRETGEWRDTKPTKEENYPYGMRDEEGNKLQPLWMGFSYYFNLDAVRQPHKTQSLERYQRGVNLGRPAEGKSGEVGPMQQYERAPQWFKDMFPPDTDYKGKFDELFGCGPNPQSFNLGVRDVKRGKKGTSAQSGELKASEKEVEEYEYPEKHHGSSMINQASLHRDRFDRAAKRSIPMTPPHHAHRFRESDFGAEATGETADFHPKGKNPGDLWSITTKPSSISVCPKCETVFRRLLKVCPYCGVEGIVGHFAPYPEALCVDPIKASTKPGDTVLDPLAGGGTTGVAAKRLGRKAILIDCVRAYCVMVRHKLQRVEYQPELEHSIGKDRRGQ